MATIIYTHTDEAPALATASLLPIVRGFARLAGVDVETRDISLAGRILAAFPQRLAGGQEVSDDLAYLGELTGEAGANIIKLPNISASLPQLKRAIGELQGLGYDLPDYPDNPADEAEREVRERYDQVKGSAVNPVLREGNSDRRAPEAVKNYARSHPHRMRPWGEDSRTRVATMDGGDFASGEQSVVMEADDTLTIALRTDAGDERILKGGIDVHAGEVVDATFMSARALDDFLTRAVAAAKDEGLLLSVHLKATMMKVSDPIIFAHALRAYFSSVFSRYEDDLARLGASASDGLGAIFSVLDEAGEEGAKIRAAFDRALTAGPPLAMVDSDRGITNLHVPSDVIIDASMPAMIRAGGRMWGPDGELHDTLAVIPDSSYAGVYQTVIEDCQRHGAFDPTTIGSVSNVGLMAKKAEEYGSHDKTFLIDEAGTVEVRSASGEVLMSHRVEAGDVWRSCLTRDEAIRDWVKLAVTRARLTGVPAIFWLDPQRAHDANLIEKVRTYLADHDTEGLDLRILSPAEATAVSVERMREGLDTISVTGNVLRDYNTDLFPIIELGTSAKMLSVVPLMGGGGLFETGAGGSAPRHVRQLVEANHLRWDSLGEFLAIAESLRHLSRVADNPRAATLAAALDHATERVLEEGKSPVREVGQIDSRGSHLWLATYWAQALASQGDDPELAEAARPLAEELTGMVDAVDAELRAEQGKAVDLGGYYRMDPQKLAAVMRPSARFNAAIDAIG